MNKILDAIDAAVAVLLAVAAALIGWAAGGFLGA